MEFANHFVRYLEIITSEEAAFETCTAAEARSDPEKLLNRRLETFSLLIKRIFSNWHLGCACGTRAPIAARSVRTPRQWQDAENIIMRAVKRSNSARYTVLRRFDIIHLEISVPQPESGALQRSRETRGARRSLHFTMSSTRGPF